MQWTERFGISLRRIGLELLYLELELKMDLLLHRLMWNPGLIIVLGYSIVLGMIFLSLPGCGAGSEQGPTISTSPTPSGSTVSLVWDPVNDSNIIGYYIHYGKQSPNHPGSCEYGQSIFVSSPQGTVTGLDKKSIYYFAVSANNGVRSECSNEVHAQT